MCVSTSNAINHICMILNLYNQLNKFVTFRNITKQFFAWVWSLLHVMKHVVTETNLVYASLFQLCLLFCLEDGTILTKSFICILPYIFTRSHRTLCTHLTDTIYAVRRCLYVLLPLTHAQEVK